ncbi:hypothetical protein FRC03_005588, partial [Tulasnella sp. 419]
MHLEARVLSLLLQQHALSTLVIRSHLAPVYWPVIFTKRPFPAASDILSPVENPTLGVTQLPPNRSANVDHLVHLEVLVIMPEGWRLYKGALIVNGHIARLLDQLSEARFQMSIRGIKFKCHLK